MLIVLADTQRPTYLYDGALVMGNLMNAAQAVGVDSCYIFRAKEVFASEEGKALDVYKRQCQMVVTVLRLQPYDELSGNADTLDLIGDIVIDALLHPSAMQAACTCI